LTRRAKVLVWDDEIEIGPEDAAQDAEDAVTGAVSASSRASIFSVPLPHRQRSLSATDQFPPPMRRTSTEAPRPVPFSAKFQRVHPGTTGVTVLEHLERLDAVEASLKRLGADDSVIEEEEEEDVAESSQAAKPVPVPAAAATPATAANEGARVVGASPRMPTAQFSPVGSPEGLPSVPEVDPMEASVDDLDEEDLVAMSKSTSHVEVSSRKHGHGHGRWATQTQDQPTIDTSRGFDWMHTEEGEAPKRTVIVEVRVRLHRPPVLCSPSNPACSDSRR
jgi:phosphatidylinositol 4-kinase type 2